MHHGVAFAEIFKQRRNGRELAANRRPFVSPPLQVLAPGNEVGARHYAKHFRMCDAGESHEVLQVNLVCATSSWVRDVREPLDLGWHVREVQKFLRGKCAGFGWDQGTG